MKHKVTCNYSIKYKLTAFSIILLAWLIYYSRFISLVYHDFLGIEYTPHVFVYVFNKDKFTHTQHMNLAGGLSCV